ncbi:hypothetical protein [Microbacterium sp. Leaf320]|uniref:hypothetical protein n=1 Tax=Microbacterium sp. Leaf320 TaxID=1736334 RepID=UPI0006F3BB29|nr:hypothetical protein [Microbacterium sp. Leaf320]KQQ65088.1 hypothetical protein ASF63_14060 [Microbacterium sp. Leaf320]
MGFTNGAGPEGTPTINNTPQTVADLTRLRDLVIERGNRFKGTTTQRDTFTTAGFAVEGHEWFDTTMGCSLIRRGSSWKREISFRIFNLARGGMTDGSAFFQVPTEDTAKDTEPAFTYSVSLEKIKLEAGIYLVSVKAHPGSATTGQSFVALRGSVQGVLPGGRGAVALNADPWMTATATFRADGSEDLIVDIQKTTGNTSNGSGVLTITKLTTL